MRSRSGFTLVEILVALVIMGVVSGAVFQLLTNSQRLSRFQTEQVSLQSNVRTGSTLVPAELRELNTFLGGNVTQNDVLAPLAADAITYRAMRGLGTVCQVPATQTQIRLRGSTYSGARDPVATDGIYIFVENDVDRDADDVWVPVQLTGVATGNVCPGAVGPEPGITLTTQANASVVGLAVGTPIRIFEVMELKLHIADGRSWLGARSVSVPGQAVQPVLGPLVDGNGFGLEYLDGAGAATANLDAIKSIRVTVRGLTDELVRGSGTQVGHPQEVLVSQVLLRNSIRP
jgi:prepilin-type N-terminal cleavage/methylation domain-containing protein